jgi:hypothetical protein
VVAVVVEGTLAGVVLLELLAVGRLVVMLQAVGAWYVRVVVGWRVLQQGLLGGLCRQGVRVRVAVGQTALAVRCEVGGPVRPANRMKGKRKMVRRMKTTMRMMMMQLMRIGTLRMRHRFVVAAAAA